MSATAATHDDLSHSDHAHEHEHHKQSFLWKYIFSTDHKIIGHLYLITSFFRPKIRKKRTRIVPPEVPSIRLETPFGETWEWKAAESDSVEGDAIAFCQVVTQTRNVADTSLAVRGETAASSRRPHRH